jgi:hypothetical protein
MSDLIKRLRGWPGPRGYAEVSILRTMTEAADKIGDMQDEIKKLRAALKDTAKHIWRGDWDKLDPETRALMGEKE